MLCCCTSNTSDSDSDSSKKCRKQSPPKDPDEVAVIPAKDNHGSPVSGSNKEGCSPESEPQILANMSSETSKEIDISESQELEAKGADEVTQEVFPEPIGQVEINEMQDENDKINDVIEINKEMSISSEQVLVSVTETDKESQVPVYAEGPTKREYSTSQECSSVREGPAEGETVANQIQEDYIARETTEEIDEMSQEALMTAVSRLEQVASRLETLACRAPSSSSSKSASSEPEVLAAFVVAFDDTFSSELATFKDLSNKIGGDVDTVSNLVSTAFQAMRDVLVIASKSKKPDDANMMKILQPLSQAIQDVQGFKDTNRTSPYFNHLSTLAEAIAALGWVSVSPTPGPFCKEMADAGMFYSNRVLKEYKEKDQNHVDWVKCWQKILTTMQAYIKEHHTTGVSWNPQGGDASAASASAPGAPAPPPGGPPAPPPPPPVLPPTEGQSSAAPDENDAKAALFADLNKGMDITKGLKKVTDSMKTHKNPALRQGPVPFKAAGPPKVAPKPAARAAPKPTDKPPVTELQDKKWVVEYHTDNQNITISDTELKQTLYIYKCTRSNIIVKGKINSITMDNCKKVAVVFDDLVSSMEFINCQSVKGQAMGVVPTISIDKTDGCQIFLSEKSLNVEIVTAKSSEMNICVPKGDGDFTEFALPEQFKTKYNGTKMVTECADSI